MFHLGRTMAAYPRSAGALSYTCAVIALKNVTPVAVRLNVNRLAFLSV